MEKSEIERYLITSRSKSVIIFRENSEDYLGFVKTIEFKPNNKVLISFDSHGYEEGGIYYEGSYASLDEAIIDIERYLGVSITGWQNCTKTGFYPELNIQVSSGQEVDKLQSDLAIKKIKLPSKSSWKVL